ncbi:MAG: hypothetical protein COW08_07295 [Ignavibacteriales bacterium CG12_big_fil_rev_8_21_14_0_65_30_8]|nr:MAG: hypothetical protein COW08_07295 [Ignavibacteriales bacterium CG12_big_fil_rev_8_21_14_0_65_30_8]
MKHLFQLLSLSIILLTFPSNRLTAQNNPAVADSVSQKAGNLIVRINKFESDEGEAKIALNNSEENYRKGKPFKAIAAKIVDGKLEFVFENIPFGEYAVKCYHDENSNGKMDSNFLGIPSEAYGFSNNARGSFGPPDYEDAKFLFSADNQVIEFQVK